MATRNDVLKAVRELPGQSNVITRLLRAIDDRSSDARVLGDLVAADPALLVNVLRVANSPMLGCRARVTDPQHAVALLGGVSLRAITVAAMARLSLPAAEWSHALAAGAAAAVLAEDAGVPVPTAYAAGLLHDIGRVVQRQLAGHLLVAHDIHDVTSLELERRKHHLDHAEFGQVTLEILGFPPEVIDAVASHHDESGVAGRPLAAVVSAANHIAHVVDEPTLRPGRHELLSISLAAAGRCIEELDDLVESTKIEAGRQAQLVLG